MKRKIGRKMTLNRETLTNLDRDNLKEAAGGLTQATTPCSNCSICFGDTCHTCIANTVCTC